MLINYDTSTPTLTISQFFKFTGYLINTNGIADIKTKLDDNTHKTVQKTSVLKDIIRINRINAVHLIETHGTDLRKCFNLAHLDTHQSEINRKRGTAMIHIDGKAELKCKALNVVITTINLEEQKCHFIAAYFPPNNKDTEKTICVLDYQLSLLSGERIILAGDFNSVSSISEKDQGGDNHNPALSIKDEKINSFLTRWKFTDIFNQNIKNEKKWDHYTHWNWEGTKGKRIDKIFTNFEHNMEVTTKTITHPWADHKGVIYTFKGKEKKKEKNKNRKLLKKWR